MTTKKNLKQIEIKLQKELTRLQRIYNEGHELSVKHLPDVVKESINGNTLSGEVNSNIILIYECDEDIALVTLQHEFIEFLIYPYIRDYLEVINYQNNLLTKLLCQRKEDLVEKFRKSL